MVTDIDECEEYGACPDDHMFCVNIPGSFQCTCDKGYKMENGKCHKEAPGERESQLLRVGWVHVSWQFVVVCKCPKQCWIQDTN